MQTKLGLALLLLSASALIESTARADDHSAIMPFVTDDVAAIGYLDLEAADMSALPRGLRDFGVLPPDQFDVVAKAVVKTQRWFKELVGHGATRAYVLLRASDIQHLGPTWVLPLTENAEPEAVIRTVRSQFVGRNRLALLPIEFQVAGGAVLAAMDKAQMRRLVTRRRRTPRKELVAALAELGDSNAGLIVLGDADSRRVLREMFPKMPAPFDSVDGRMIADDLLWGGVTVDLPPQPKVTIHVETSGPQVAATLQQSSVELLELGKPLVAALLADTPARAREADIPRALELFEPKTEGASVALTLADGAEELSRMRNLLSPLTVAAHEPLYRKQRISRFRQLAIAFANYESTHNTLLAQANYDQNGKPLLSWRVHLLPYLEEQTLYEQFHLNEPWDSPHNRKLIERMPKIYSDPSGTVRQNVGAGRTTFVAPVGDATLFPPQLPEGEPLRIRDVRDGTSKTILFVEVVPERAVVWTKPEDWNVNMDDPLQGVKRSDRSGFVVAYCDAFVRYTSNDIAPQDFRARLTRAGGEQME